jgi:hypothetical protein
MVAFIVKHRTTTAWKEETVDAETREAAIQKVIDAAPEETEVEVSNVTEDAAAPKAAPKKASEEHHAKK